MMRNLMKIVVCALGLSGATAAVAQQSPGQEIARAEFLPGWRQADGSHVAGLLIDLKPGWKTYWRSPGDAGIPPRFNWSGSRNIGDLRPVWPTPRVMDQNGMTSIGYPGDVVIPFVIRPDAAGREVQLRAQMELGVCKDICVPATLTFSGVLPRSGTRDPRLVAAMVDQPLSAAEAKVGKVTCRISPQAGGMTVTASIPMASAGGPEFVVIETANPAIWVSEAVTRREGRDLIAVTEMSHVNGTAFAVDRSRLRFTVLGHNHAVDIQGCAAR